MYLFASFLIPTAIMWNKLSLGKTRADAWSKGRGRLLAIQVLLSGIDPPAYLIIFFFPVDVVQGKLEGFPPPPAGIIDEPVKALAFKFAGDVVPVVGLFTN